MSDRIEIAEPCTVDWTRMDGCGARRFCGSCRKHVTDLSQLTERQARAVMAKPDQCVRFTSDAAGNIRYRPSLAARAMAVGAVLLPGAAIASGQPADSGGEGLLHRLGVAVGLVEPDVEPVQVEFDDTNVTMGLMVMSRPASAFTIVNHLETGSVSVDCDDFATPEVLEPGATRELLVQDWGQCTLTARGADGTPLVEQLQWSDHTRTCEIGADGWVCSE